MKKYFAFLFLGLIILQACQSKTKEAVNDKNAEKVTVVDQVENKTEPQKVTNDAAAILSKKEVPILCYHQIQSSTFISMFK